MNFEKYNTLTLCACIVASFLCGIAIGFWAAWEIYEIVKCK